LDKSLGNKISYSTNTDDIKNTVQAKFKESMWCNKELEDKRRLQYYKEVVNHNLEDKED
jgi:hypothetical protein